MMYWLLFCKPRQPTCSTSFVEKPRRFFHWNLFENFKQVLLWILFKFSWGLAMWSRWMFLMTFFSLLRTLPRGFKPLTHRFFIFLFLQFYIRYIILSCIFFFYTYDGTQYFYSEWNLWILNRLLFFWLHKSVFTEIHHKIYTSAVSPF